MDNGHSCRRNGRAEQGHGCMKGKAMIIRDFSELTLCNYKDDHLDSFVTAEVKDGKLTISGQDFNMLAEELFGDSEYEYFYALNQENTLLLATLLKGETFAEALVNYFSGLDGCKQFREFCDAHNIEYKSHTYFG